MSIHIDKAIIERFDRPGPRYTSYPTAPIWSEEVQESTYIGKLNALGQTDKTLSLYIHIPFCQTMCTYCACNVVIRPKDEKYAEEYLYYLFREMDLVRQHLGKRMTIRQFHWGGGTPTFLNEDQIERLYRKVEECFTIDPQGEVAIEIDPRTIDRSKVRKLKSLGFNRISMGVQDFSESVQEEVNRIQPFELVKSFNDYCRALDFSSVNFDLIYGLPSQTLESFRDTVENVIRLKPDRIALYSFAYVPWLKRHQQKIDQTHLPSNDHKLDIFLMARELFLNADYQAIAMDHFALKDDELAKAYHQGNLYRNFMGYTTKPADEFLGLGLTSIGFLENTFVQNHKALPQYYKMLEAGHLPTERGKELNRDDQIRQWTINSLMCHFVLDKSVFQSKFNAIFDEYFTNEKDHINRCITDGLLVITNDQIRVSELGKIFIRNVCMGFDYYLQHQQTDAKFSKTV